MRFKSGVLGSARGSVGGLTYQEARGGSIARARHKPRDPASVAQVERRHAFGFLRIRWREQLTSAQRSGWEDYAKGTTIVSPEGVAKRLTGEQMYVRSGSVRSQALGEGAVIDDPPRVNGLPRFSLVSAFAQVFINRVGLTFRSDDPWRFELGSHGLLWITESVNGSVNRRRVPFVFIVSLPGDPVTPPGPFVALVSPLAMSLGQRLWLRMVVSTADGRTSAPTVSPQIVIP